MKNRVNRAFMVKKNVIVRSLLIAICAIALVGCPDGYRAPNPEFRINGTVMDETGQPIENILVSVDTAILSPSYMHEDWYEVACRTNQEGKFSKRYENGCFISQYVESWPSELIIIAVDTSGIYEKESQRFPVKLTKYGPSMFGRVTADFVMKKKK